MECLSLLECNLYFADLYIPEHLSQQISNNSYRGYDILSPVCCYLINHYYTKHNRRRKVLENRSAADEERIDRLESQLKETKYIAEDAERKYDEVTNG